MAHQSPHHTCHQLHVQTSLKHRNKQTIYLPQGSVGGADDDQLWKIANISYQIGLEDSSGAIWATNDLPLIKHDRLGQAFSFLSLLFESCENQVDRSLVTLSP